MNDAREARRDARRLRDVTRALRTKAKELGRPVPVMDLLAWLAEHGSVEAPRSPLPLRYELERLVDREQARRYTDTAGALVYWPTPR